MTRVPQLQSGKLACLIRSVIVTLVPFLTPCLFAQQLESRRENVVIRRYSVEEGLSSRVINLVVQDGGGFIWVGTDTSGLNKFDGNRFTVYRNNPSDTTSLSDNSVRALLSDRKGRLWIGTGHGLNVYDPLMNNFRRFLNDRRNPASISNDVVLSLYEDSKGQIWAGTEYGLNIFNEESRTWKHLLPNLVDSSKPGMNCVPTILEDRDGIFWFGLGGWRRIGGGLVRYDPGRNELRHFNADEHDPFRLPNDWVTSLYEDTSKVLWISTNGGVCTLDREHFTFVPFRIALRTPFSVHRMFMKTISEDRDGNLWFATWGLGVIRYDRRSAEFFQYTYDPEKPSGFASAEVQSLYIDRSGLVWVSTNGGGVNSIVRKPFVLRTSLSPGTKFNNRVSALLEDEHQILYVGQFMSGVQIYLPSAQNPIQLPLPPPRAPETHGLVTNQAPSKDLLQGRSIISLKKERSGSILILDDVYGELIRYNPRLKTASVLFRTQTREPDYTEYASSMFVDGDETIWVGGSHLYHIRNDGRMLETYAFDDTNPGGISRGEVLCIQRDRMSKLWIGLSSGLNRYEEKTGAFKKVQNVVGDTTSLSANMILNLMEDRRGRLWVGTAAGLDLYRPETESFVRIRAVNGITPMRVESIIEDSRGNIWAATDAGLSRVDVTKTIMWNFDRSDGLPTVEFEWGCNLVRKNGELYFGARTGLLTFCPDDVHEEELAPPIVITGFKKLNQPVLAGPSPECLKEAVLQNTENVFSISYSALSFDEFEMNRYAYRLEGFDRDWFWCGTRREAVYTNLNPGTYTFHVIGSDHRGNWNNLGASLRVTVLPPWWRTWWFQTIAAISALSVIVGGVRYISVRKFRRTIERLEHQRAMERERARISQDMHDEVGASLTEISILSELMRKDPQEVERQIPRISKRVSEAIESFGEIVWSVNPKNDSLDNLVAHLRRYAANFLGLSNITCNFRIPEDIPPNYVTSAVRHNIVLVTKETLNNLVKYSDAKRVDFAVEIGNGEIELRIRDDGKGFLAGHVRGGGNGLANMKKRMDEVGGTFRIQSAPGHGTEVAFLVKIAPIQESGQANPSS